MLNLGAQLGALVEAGCRAVHVDVMDAHFVPNLTVGPDFARAAAAPIHAAGGLVDVHLMVSRPAHMIPLFAAHADAISVHLEADPHPHRLLGMIREHGARAGIALNPGTPVEHVGDLVDQLDYVVVMSVNPGYAGQSFITATPDRVARLRALLPDRVAIEVDGGIGSANLPAVRAAGANMFVSASSIFGSADPVAAYAELARLATA
jgi:ribulose-phosphate 3-epimerase